MPGVSLFLVLATASSSWSRARGSISPRFERTDGTEKPYVIGGPDHEVRIDTDRLLFVNVVQPGPGGASTEISFNKDELFETTAWKRAGWIPKP